MTVLTCNKPLPISRSTYRACGEPATFRYQGIVALKGGETYQHAIMRRGQIVLDLCMEHTRETFVNMDSALHSGQATIRCLVQNKLTLHCGKCKSLFRFEALNPIMNKHADRPSVTDGYNLIPNHFCPCCGAPAVSVFNPELDYWELLTATLPGELTATLVQTIYSHFLKDPTATAKFVDYITQIMAELDAAAT